MSMIEEIVKVKLSDGAILPKKAHLSDSGYDVVAISDPIIKKNEDGDVEYIEYKTGIFIEPLSENIDLFLMPRSSICKYNLMLCNSVGLVDNSYRGELLFRFKYIYQYIDIINHGNINENKIYKKGDKIGQMVFRKKTNTVLEISESLGDSERSDRGFGSTGK